jgi:hypothetical protein
MGVFWWASKKQPIEEMADDGDIEAFAQLYKIIEKLKIELKVEQAESQKWHNLLMKEMEKSKK